MSRREADVTVTLQPPATGPFHAEKLTDYRLFLYGTRAYLRNASRLRSTPDLRHHVFAGYIEDLVFTRGLDYLPDLGGGVVAPRLQNSSLAAQMLAAASGACLCVLPGFVAASRPELIRLLAAEIELTRTYWMVMPAEEADSARIRCVRQFLRQEVNAAAGIFDAG